VEVENCGGERLALTAIPDQHADLSPRDPCPLFHGGRYRVAAVSDAGPICGGGWRFEVPPSGKRTVRFAFILMGGGEEVPGSHYAPDIEDRIARAARAWRSRLALAAARLPRIEGGPAGLVVLYRRSILSVLMCRFENERYIVSPFYDCGQGEGSGCCWDMSFSTALISCFDPDGLKGMILANVRAGVMGGTIVEWDGRTRGWYVQHPFSMARAIEDYVRQTGDGALLDRVESGKPVLEHMKSAGRELARRYLTPDGLLDFGESTGQFLEIRTSGYNRVVAAGNALAADFFGRLSEWCRERGDPEADRFGELARRVADAVNSRLWNEDAGWFDNLGPGGTRHTVFSYHQLEALGVDAIPIERRRRMAERVREGEFLGEYGMFSISRKDLAHWDREDCDWGGGGQFVGMPGRIAGHLFQIGETCRAWDILVRVFRWSERLPYFPQTLYADELALQEHQKYWPVQVSAGAGAQAVLFGAFGLRPAADGSISIGPAWPEWAGEAMLRGYVFRGHAYDVHVDRSGFRVFRDGEAVGGGRSGDVVRPD
ncbi:MAG: alpha,alpha-trehalase, partial [Planctomycetota bacterium]|nr:alpha,alpha-trehalase [Planctomycetota bacterium]